MEDGGYGDRTQWADWAGNLHLSSTLKGGGPSEGEGQKQGILLLQVISPNSQAPLDI